MPVCNFDPYIIRCQSCIFWQPHRKAGVDLGASDSPQGTCRRHAPAVLNLSRGPATVWPGTNSEDGCAEGSIRAGVGHAEGSMEAHGPTLMPEGMADEAPR